MSMASLPSISKMTNDELICLGIDEVIRMFRKCDNERVQMMAGRSSMMNDFNKRMHMHLLEVRELKDVNQRLQEDNQELRDLCCFLDDDRQKSRKLAREWQRFGKYTASVMKSEVTTYQDKLNELELKQQELLKENLDLKELCLMLDQEQQGKYDKSTSWSSSQVAVETTKPTHKSKGSGECTSANDISTTHSTTAKSQIDEQTQQYIKQLEDRLEQVEHISNNQLPAPQVVASPSHTPVRFFSTPQPLYSSTGDAGSRDSLLAILPPEVPDELDPIKPCKSEAVVNAMKVLEVHEHLEKPLTEQDEMDDDEKALVREMCNVVWRKLGESVPGYKPGS